MVVRTICSVAFYCQRCGQIHIQDVPCFSGQKKFVLRCGNCSHEQALVSFRPHKGLVIEISCGVCGTKNTVTYPLRLLRKMQFEKIYCGQDQFELGYIGRWQSIAEFLDFNTAEYEALHPGDEDNFMGRQQILLEAVNRVHDMVEDGGISCPCGSSDFMADVAEDSIVLECAHCGSYAVVPAGSAEDLREIGSGCSLEFLLPDSNRVRKR